MNTSGDAAEQIVRLSLEGTEVALKLTGSAAKHIAAMLYAALKNKDKNKTKGRQRLTAMLKSGKELKVFTVSADNLKQFTQEAKRYGVVYCALREKGSSDGMVDLMVRAEDAPKINRIVERFKFATVDSASIKRDIEQSKAEKAAAPAVPAQDMPEKSADDTLLDELMGAPMQKEAAQPKNPEAAKSVPFRTAAEKSPPSATIFGNKAASERDASDTPKRSVREELREITAQRKQEAPKREETPAKDKSSKAPKTAKHKQPKKKKQRSNSR